MNPRAGSSVTNDPVRGVIINGLGASAIGGGGNTSLSPGRATGTVPSQLSCSASIPLSLGRSLYLPTQSQASYRSASLSPSARCPSSGFDVDNEEANARENVVVADGHADVRASAAMPYDNDDANDGNFDKTLGKILNASFRVTPSLDLDLAFGAIDSNVDLARTHPTPLPLLSLPSPLLLLLLLLGSPSEIHKFSVS